MGDAEMTGSMQRSCYYLVSWLPIGRMAGIELANWLVCCSYFWLVRRRIRV